MSELSVVKLVTGWRYTTAITGQQSRLFLWSLGTQKGRWTSNWQAPQSKRQKDFNITVFNNSIFKSKNKEFFILNLNSKRNKMQRSNYIMLHQVTKPLVFTSQYSLFLHSNLTLRDHEVRLQTEVLLQKTWFVPWLSTSLYLCALS